MSSAPRLPMFCAGAAAAGFAVAIVAHDALVTRTSVAAGALLVGWAFVATERRLRKATRKIAALAAENSETDPSGIPSLDSSLQSLERRLVNARQLGRRFESVLNGIGDAVLVVNASGDIRESNVAATQLLGWSSRELVGRPLASLISPEQRQDFEWRRALTASRDYVIETASGAVLPAAIKGSPLIGSDDTVVVLHDITDQRRAERRVNYLTLHDGLTRVPNRMQFQHLLQQTLASARKDGTVVALLYIDVDHFKEVNDTFGHAAGDRALEVLSERLSTRLPTEAVIGRLAGDEFAVFLSLRNPEDRLALTSLAQDILNAGSRVFFLSDTEIYLTLSIGIALSESSSDNSAELLRSADVAMYHAKQSGGGTYAFYDATMSAAAAERLILKAKLRRSLERDELITLYQPLIDLQSGVTIGAEALLRWRLPGHGDVPPSEFIPLAEQSNLIDAIGDWVFHRVCTDLNEWKGAGLAPARVCINLSLRQFGRPGAVERIAAILREHAVNPALIELEITESTLMEDERSAPILASLTALGFRIAIDDFGTGYSSLSALRRMPVQTLKIDQSFVRRITDGGDDEALIRTIIEMGRNFGLEVVAEGIETEYQRQCLQRQGCHLGQGRLFGAPMSAGAFRQHLRSLSSEPVAELRSSA